KLGVVVQLVARPREIVAVVGAGRVGRAGDREALVGGAAGRGGELAKQPAVGLAVVEDDRIAPILGLAGAAEAGEEAVAVERAEEAVAAFVEDLDDAVDPFDVVVGADVTPGVGG